MNIQSLPEGFEPLPPYADVRRALQATLPSLRPPAQVSVTEAAEKSMRVNVAGQWQKFRRDVTPYMIEAADQIPSRDYKGLVFCGPSQSGKTLALTQAPIVYAVTSDAARIALFQMNRDKANEFGTEKLEPMIRNSPDLASRLAKGVGANRMHQKVFRGGTHLTLNWPTPEQMASSTIRFMLGTDFDSFGKRGHIGGEGDAFTMMKNRPRTYRSRGMVLVESSPKAPIIDETWVAKSPHEAPPVEFGVLMLYNDGTRGRWYWPCPQCGELFEPHYKLLQYPDTSDPAEAGEAAEMVAPCCGYPFGHELKQELNAADAAAWLHETAGYIDDAGQVRFDVVPLSSGRVRKTDTLSYWLNGAAAAFSTWKELVEDHVKAERRFADHQDDKQLITSFNTNRGEPMLQTLARGENEITLSELKAKAVTLETPKGVAPSWARYVLVWVDTQKTYFAATAIAFGDAGRHQIIDRFDIVSPPETAPNFAERVIDPFNRAEDWAALEPLTSRFYPVEGADFGLVPVCVGVDQQGGGQTTENAYSFFRGRRAANEGGRWYLTRGEGRKPASGDRVWLRAPEGVSTKSKINRRSKASKRRPASDIEILNIYTDGMKNAVASSLRLEGGRNVCLLASWLADDEPHLVELTAEIPNADGKWEKRPGMTRNELLDGAVGCRAMNIIIGGEKIDAATQKPWAILGPSNFYARSVVVESGEGKVARPAVNVPEGRKRRRGRFGIKS